MNVDGFNQKIIDSAIFDRVNNPKTSEGYWTDPEGKSIMKAYQGQNFVVKKQKRAIPKPPAGLMPPEEESNAQKKNREQRLDKWKSDRATWYDIYKRMGNPVQTFAKLKAEEVEEDE